MLRQLIGELEQHLILLHGSHSPPPSRWCYFNLDGDPKEDRWYTYVIKADKSGICEMLQPSKPPPSKKPRRERNRTKLLDPSSSTQSMEDHIWKDFPEDLFEAVIARLPIATFFRFRSVCRKWNTLLSSNSFSQQCSQVPQTQPWFYIISRGDMNSWAMYDPSFKKWHHPSALGLPTKEIVLPVASTGGLVCFLDIGHKLFYVCNPLTRSFKELPSRLVKVWSRIAVGMTLNQNSENWGYKVLWVSCDGEHEVYDSINNMWARPGPMPSSIKLPLHLNFRSQAISIDSTLYFMRSDPDGIVSYNTITGIWKQFLIPIPIPINLSDQTLAECEGRIFLVGLLTKKAATCICIWELQKMTLLWKEVDRMPNIRCLDFYGKHVQMTCVGNKGLLMLSLRSRQMNHLVSYDIANKEWLKVPCGKRRQWVACGTAFYPCLTASA